MHVGTQWFLVEQTGQSYKPLNVSVNKPFKVHLREEYESWLLPENILLTPSGTTKKEQASKFANKDQLLQRKSQRQSSSTLRNATSSKPRLAQQVAMRERITDTSRSEATVLRKNLSLDLNDCRTALTTFTFFFFWCVHRLKYDF